MLAPPRKTRLLLVDDHPVIRQGVRACLEAAPHLEIVAEAGDGEEAVRLALAVDPDVIVMDINMPRRNGLAATVEILAQRPGSRVLILTIHDQPDYVTAAVRVGAFGCLSKDSLPETLVRAIERVAAGEPQFALEDTVRFLRRYLPAPPCVVAPPLKALTTREREVLSLIGQGLTNREIAERLVVALRTVETYRERLMRKLDMHDATALRAYASVQDLLPQELPASAGIGK